MWRALDAKQLLYHSKNSFVDEYELRETLAKLLIDLICSVYDNEVSKISIRERFSDHVVTENNRLVEADEDAQQKRDMSSRQKVYWAVVALKCSWP